MLVMYATGNSSHQSTNGLEYLVLFVTICTSILGLIISVIYPFILIISICTCAGNAGKYKIFYFLSLFLIFPIQLFLSWLYFVVAISSIAVAGFFTVAVGYFLLQIFKIYILRKRGILASAKIISKGTVSNGYAGKFGNAYNFSIEYEFAIDNKTYRKKLQNIRKAEFEAYEQGQVLDVIYAPANPNNNCLKNKLGNQNIVMILFFAGCCYIVINYITSLKI